MTNQAANITLDKELRRDIDAIIQRLKADMENKAAGNLGCRFSRERSLAVTKLQEAVMWLGMDLKAIGDESAGDNDRVEELAKEIYDKLRSDDPEGKDRPWVTGGNSLKQEEARKMARADLRANPYPNSKDPSNTKIDPTADGLKL